MNKDIFKNIKIKCEFVPLSQSRNKDNENKSLNWIVILFKNNHRIMTTDYMQGMGHAPSHKNPPKLKNGKIDKYLLRKAEKLESEIGYKAFKKGDDMIIFKEKKYKVKEPNIKDVLYCLTMDSEVLNYESFQDWAESIGFDVDSIKHKKIYKDCLKTALKINAHFNLSELQEYFADF